MLFLHEILGNLLHILHTTVPESKPLAMGGGGDQVGQKPHQENFLPLQNFKLLLPIANTF